jgi:hypothetical protein
VLTLLRQQFGASKVSEIDRLRLATDLVVAEPIPE